METIELRIPEAVTQQTASTFQHRRRQTRRLRLQSTEYSRRHRHNDSDIPNEEPQSLLLLLRLLSYREIQIFTSNASQQWNLRQHLGKGSTFSAEEAELPIWRALFRLQYRNVDLKSRGEKSYFNDHTHTKWRHDTLVAYKGLVHDVHRSRELITTDLITEIRVLCHPPLQKHPNILRLLGVAWVTERDIESTPELVLDPSGESGIREWPNVVTEKAPYGTLFEFLSSDEFKDVRSSLLSKLRLCIDVLSGISALHTCDILHGDIKCENALVFKSEDGTGENWRVKISDFSHSILNVEDDMNGFIRQEIIGTDLYSPPELNITESFLNVAEIKSIDIWCWGMLLWQVMIDGMSYTDLDGQPIDKDKMRDLRAEVQVADIAQQMCRKYLETHHGQERIWFSTVIEALSVSLHSNPSDRPSAARMLGLLQQAVGERYIELPSMCKAESLESLERLPFFDLTKHYYDLREMISVPHQIFKELEIVKAISSIESQEAVFQLGLCYAVGFGTDHNYDIAVRLIKQAASEGLWKARVLVPRVSAALGFPLDAETQDSIKMWLEKGSEMGSRTASKDMERLDTKRYLIHYRRTQTQKEERLNPEKDVLNEPEYSADSLLLAAAKRGDLQNLKELIATGANVNYQGQYGENPLHYAVLLPEQLSLSIAETLLNARCDIFHPSSRSYPLSRHDFLLNEFPKHTTPLEWAMMDDSVHLVRLFMELGGGISHPSFSSSMVRSTPLAFAVQHQSIKCLDYFLKELKKQGTAQSQINVFDMCGYSAFYYSVRPDFFDRLFRFVPDEDASHRSNIPPMMARELKVIEMLLASGSKMDVNSKGLFNCIHILTAVGDPCVLERILEKTDSIKLINKESQYGWTPLQDAIVRGREDCFRILLEKGADPSRVWPKLRLHALHVCSLFPGDFAITIAERLLQKDPSCVKARDRFSRTPLHNAASFGHTKLAAFLLLKGADILSTAADGITPLGSAIRTRSVRGVKKLRMEHERRRLPFLVFSPGSFCGLRFCYFSAFEYLLAPGRASPTAIPQMRIPHSPFGCCDHPFSRASQKVLEELLDQYTQRVKFGVNLIQYFTYPSDRQSGIRYALQMGNIEAVKLILESRKFKLDSRHLVKLAFLQRIIGKLHIASEEVREELVLYLQQNQEEEWESVRQRRQNSRLHWLWRLYYKLYGTMEQDEYKRANKWWFDNRYLWYRLVFIEFHPWIRARYPVIVGRLILVWCLLCPTIICAAIVAADPTTRYHARNTVLMILIITVLALWPQIFRIVTIFYYHSKRDLDGRDWILCLLQISFCLVVLALSVFDIWILQPTNAQLLPFKPYNVLDNSTLNSLPPWRQKVLANFHSLCQALEAWNVLVNMIPALYMVATCLMKWRTGRNVELVDLLDPSVMKTYVASEVNDCLLL